MKVLQRQTNEVGSSGLQAREEVTSSLTSKISINRIESGLLPKEGIS
jgi:hypothetical protein